MGSNCPNGVPLVRYSSQLMLLVLIISMVFSCPDYSASAAGNTENDREKVWVSNGPSGREKDTEPGTVYIVYMGHHKNRDKDLIVNHHLELLSLVKGSIERATESILYHYKHSFSGFAAILTSDEADQFSRMEDVVSVLPSGELELQTTRSWEFLGLLNGTNNMGSISYSSELWDLAKQGKDVIIGVVDSGIWPESRSFDDDGMEELPPNFWRGECEEGQLFTKSNCNKKIIGARTFRKGFEQNFGPVEQITTNFRSARDAYGHGTHMAAVAGGRMVPNVSGYGNGPIAEGTATGGFPLARLAIYKACWFRHDSNPLQGAIDVCMAADMLAAVDVAIADGVHILSVSLIERPSGSDSDRPFHLNSIAIGGLHAIQAGVLVSTNVGNFGPAPGSARNLAPWVISAASTSIDRRFLARIQLLSEGSVTGLVEGESLTPFNGIQLRSIPIVRGKDALRKDLTLEQLQSAIARECQITGTLAEAKVKNKIVFCLAANGTNPYTQSVEVKLAGGVAMISGEINKGPISRLMITQVPTISVMYDESQEIQRQYAVFMGLKGVLLPLLTTFSVKPAPVVAEFSSRGPNVLTPSVLKPDISAPGVQILSAWAGAIGPTAYISDRRRTAYNIGSGNSVASAHVSAIAALLKSIHPSWSPSAIKSAIMTTASHVDNMGEPIKGYARNSSNHKVLEEATPFSVGAGQINPRRAVDPGLIYDATPNDYHEFICNIGYNETTLRKMANSNVTKCPETLGEPNALNQPYVVVDLSKVHTTTVVRKVTNVGPSMSIYRAIVTPSNSPSVELNVEPRSLTFTEVGQTHTFRVDVSVAEPSNENFHFGSLTWMEDHGSHTVTIPIIVST